MYVCIRVDIQIYLCIRVDIQIYLCIRVDIQIYVCIRGDIQIFPCQRIPLKKSHLTQSAITYLHIQRNTTNLDTRSKNILIVNNNINAEWNF
jgi:hypothetical protein